MFTSHAYPNVTPRANTIICGCVQDEMHRNLAFHERMMERRDVFSQINADFKRIARGEPTEADIEAEEFYYQQQAEIRAEMSAPQHLVW